MKSDIALVLGGLAAVASTVSFAPQALKIIKSRRTADISARMYAVTVLGFALWLAYGLLLGQWPLVLSNGLCFLLSGFILVMKLSPPRIKNEIADAIDPNTKS